MLKSEFSLMHFDSSALRVRAVAENGGWSLFAKGLPLVADGANFEQAVAEMIVIAP
ncbi:hypothetical protein [Nocardia sp. NPDC057455]|uniref:hypothetical protein n=1 Tax=Nocardia sp. NPDC057455 TaxID=3346138 RepID=UPI00366A9B50